jgi:hypothetical protein
MLTFCCSLITALPALICIFWTTSWRSQFLPQPKNFWRMALYPITVLFKTMPAAMASKMENLARSIFASLLDTCIIAGDDGMPTRLTCFAFDADSQ